MAVVGVNLWKKVNVFLYMYHGELKDGRWLGEGGWWGGSSMDLISDRNPATFHPVTVGETFFLGEPCLLIYN